MRKKLNYLLALSVIISTLNPIAIPIRVNANPVDIVEDDTIIKIEDEGVKDDVRVQTQEELDKFYGNNTSRIMPNYSDIDNLAGADTHTENVYKAMGYNGIDKPLASISTTGDIGGGCCVDKSDIDRVIGAINKAADRITNQIKKAQHEYKVGYLYSKNNELKSALWRPKLSEVPEVIAYVYKSKKYANLYTGFWDAGINPKDKMKPGQLLGIPDTNLKSDLINRATRILGDDIIVKNDIITYKSNPKEDLDFVGPNTPEEDVNVKTSSIHMDYDKYIYSQEFIPEYNVTWSDAIQVLYKAYGKQKVWATVSSMKDSSIKPENSPLSKELSNVTEFDNSEGAVSVFVSRSGKVINRKSKQVIIVKEKDKSLDKNSKIALTEDMVRNTEWNDYYWELAKADGLVYDGTYEYNDTYNGARINGFGLSMNKNEGYKEYILPKIIAFISKFGLVAPKKGEKVEKREKALNIREALSSHEAIDIDRDYPNGLPELSADEVINIETFISSFNLRKSWKDKKGNPTKDNKKRVPYKTVDEFARGVFDVLDNSIGNYNGMYNRPISGEEFIKLAVAFMKLNGEPAMSKKEENLLLQAYGAQYPAQLGRELSDDWMYLKSRGVLNVNVDYYGAVDRNTLLDIALCIGDVNSRTDFKKIVPTLNLSDDMVDKGFYPVDNVYTNRKAAVDVSINYSQAAYWDYFLDADWELMVDRNNIDSVLSDSYGVGDEYLAKYRKQKKKVKGIVYEQELDNDALANKYKNMLSKFKSDFLSTVPYSKFTTTFFNPHTGDKTQSFYVVDTDKDPSQGIIKLNRQFNDNEFTYKWKVRNSSYVGIVKDKYGKRYHHFRVDNAYMGKRRYVNGKPIRVIEINTDDPDDLPCYIELPIGGGVYSDFKLAFLPNLNQNAEKFNETWTKGTYLNRLVLYATKKGRYSFNYFNDPNWAEYVDIQRTDYGTFDSSEEFNDEQIFPSIEDEQANNTILSSLTRMLGLSTIKVNAAPKNNTKTPEQIAGKKSSDNRTTEYRFTNLDNILDQKSNNRNSNRTAHIEDKNFLSLILALQNSKLSDIKVSTEYNGHTKESRLLFDFDADTNGVPKNKLRPYYKIIGELYDKNNKKELGPIDRDLFRDVTYKLLGFYDGGLSANNTNSKYRDAVNKAKKLVTNNSTYKGPIVKGYNNPSTGEPLHNFLLTVGDDNIVDKVYGAFGSSSAGDFKAMMSGAKGKYKFLNAISTLITIVSYLKKNPNSTGNVYIDKQGRVKLSISADKSTHNAFSDEAFKNMIGVSKSSTFVFDNERGVSNSIPESTPNPNSSGTSDSDSSSTDAEEQGQSVTAPDRMSKKDLSRIGTTVITSAIMDRDKNLLVPWDQIVELGIGEKIKDGEQPKPNPSDGIFYLPTKRGTVKVNPNNNTILLGTTFYNFGSDDNDNTVLAYSQKNEVVKDGNKTYEEKMYFDIRCFVGVTKKDLIPNATVEQKISTKSVGVGEFAVYDFNIGETENVYESEELPIVPFGVSVNNNTMTKYYPKLEYIKETKYDDQSFTDLQVANGSIRYYWGNSTKWGLINTKLKGNALKIFKDAYFKRKSGKDNDWKSLLPKGNIFDGKPNSYRISLTNFNPISNYIIVIKGDGGTSNASLFVWYPRDAFGKAVGKSGNRVQIDSSLVPGATTGTLNSGKDANERAVKRRKFLNKVKEINPQKLDFSSSPTFGKNLESQFTKFNSKWREKELNEAFYNYPWKIKEKNGKLITVYDYKKDSLYWFDTLTAKAAKSLYEMTSGGIWLDSNYVIREFNITYNSPLYVKPYSLSVGRGTDTTIKSYTGNNNSTVYWLDGIGYVYNVPRDRIYKHQDYLDGRIPLPISYDIKSKNFIDYNIDSIGSFTSTVLDKDKNIKNGYGWVPANKSFVNVFGSRMDAANVVSTGIGSTKDNFSDGPRYAINENFIPAPMGAYIHLGGINQDIVSGQDTVSGLLSSDIVYYGHFPIMAKEINTTKVYRGFIQDEFNIEPESKFYKVLNSYLGRDFYVALEMTGTSYLSVGGEELKYTDGETTDVFDFISNIKLKEWLNYIDSGVSYIILITLQVIPAIMLIAITLLVGLSVLSDNEIWKSFCSKTIDPVKILTLGYSDVERWHWRTVIIPCLLLWCTFALVLNGNIFRVLQWGIEWFITIREMILNTI